MLIILLVSLSCAATAQQEPDLIANNGISARYPDTIYINGFGIGEGESAAERTEMADQNARTDLSSKFIVRIQTIFNPVTPMKQ